MPTRLLTPALLICVGIQLAGCASGPEKRSASFPCGSGTIGYNSYHSQVYSYLSVSSVSMSDADRRRTSIDYYLGDGETLLNRPVPAVNTPAIKLPLGTGNRVTIRCPGGVVHTASNDDKTEGLASNRRIFSAVEGLGQAANKMQAEADARREYQNYLYANASRRPASASTSASTSAPANADDNATGAPVTAPVRNSATAASAASEAKSSSSVASGTIAASSGSRDRTAGPATPATASGNTSASTTTTAPKVSTATDSKAGGKAAGPGVLIVDDSAHQARLKQQAATAALQKTADAAAAREKAKYAAEAAVSDARTRAAIEEQARLRKLRGRSQ